MAMYGNWLKVDTVGALIGVGIIGFTLVLTYFLQPEFFDYFTEQGREKVQERRNDLWNIRRFVDDMPLTVLSADEIADICKCNVEYINEFVGEGVTFNKPFKRDELATVGKRLVTAKVCGIASLNRFAVVKGGGYHVSTSQRWTGVPFKSDACEAIRKIIPR